MFHTGNPNPNELTGALIGGPDENDVFEDKRDNYQQNEVALDYNAGFQGALAGIIWAELGRTEVEKDLKKINKSVEWYEGLTYWHGTKLIDKNPSLKDRKVEFSSESSMQISLIVLFFNLVLYFNVFE